MKFPANYTILAIETSLDDTCAAVTRDDRVIANMVASQVKFHEEFGGTVPHIAKRKHLEWIDQTVDEALVRAGLLVKSTHHPRSLEDAPSGHFGGDFPEIDAVAVTYGPGLAPCLEVGIAKAKELANLWKKPLVAVNHMEGHLLSALAKNSKGRGPFFAKKPEFPALGFLISGGHTQLVLIKGIGKYELLGETLDDAAGEAYDKVARMLNLGYPGGPFLTQIAKEGVVRYDLPEPMRERKDLNFSFSGLKTAAMQRLRKLNDLESDSLQGRAGGSGMTIGFSRQFVADFAASFQAAVMKMLSRRLQRAIDMYHPKMIWLGGGVISNVAIRKMTRQVARACRVPVIIPYSHRLFTDNAAMIGVAAWYKARRGEFLEDIEALDRVPGLSF
jgi:N6-L-threonylcarbamoyladenine synthase